MRTFIDSGRASVIFQLAGEIHLAMRISIYASDTPVSPYVFNAVSYILA